MRIEATDIAMCIMGFALALLGYYADVALAVFTGGAWVGAFLFKLGYVCEKRWGQGADDAA